jgi:transposase
LRRFRLGSPATPDIKVLSRDRGGGYGGAASKALPSAIQVADHWHLMENASSAFLSAVRQSIRPNAAILALAKNGAAIKQIVRKTGRSRRLVRQVLRGDRGDVFRVRQSSLDAYLASLHTLDLWLPE